MILFVLINQPVAAASLDPPHVLAVIQATSAPTSLIVGVPHPLTASAFSVTADGKPLPVQVKPAPASAFQVRLVLDTDVPPEQLAREQAVAAELLLQLPEAARVAVEDPGALASLAVLGSPTDALAQLRALHTSDPPLDATLGQKFSKSSISNAGSAQEPGMLMVISACSSDRNRATAGANLVPAGLVVHVIKFGTACGEWLPTLAQRTGGAVLASTPADAIATMDRFAAGLRQLYRVSFPTSAGAESVQLTLSENGITASVTVPLRHPVSSAASHGDSGLGWGWVAAAAVGISALLAFALVRRQTRHSPGSVTPAPSQQATTSHAKAPSAGHSSRDASSHRAITGHATAHRVHDPVTCPRCTLRRTVDDLLPEDADGLLTQLRPAILAGDPIPTYRWLKEVRPLVTDLQTGKLPMTHRSLDTLPPTSGIEQLRALLTTAGLLPPNPELEASEKSGLRHRTFR